MESSQQASFLTKNQKSWRLAFWTGRLTFLCLTLCKKFLSFAIFPLLSSKQKSKYAGFKFSGQEAMFWCCKKPVF